MLCLLLLLKADVVCVFCINLHNRVTILLIFTTLKVNT